jgi:formamidopyrimidine-DNA glycosylase
MPELPEVETTIRYLRNYTLNQVVKKLTVTNHGETAFNVPLEEMQKRIEGQPFTAINRIGKWMLFEFGDTKIIGHLRMSGRYKVTDKVIEVPHNRIQFHLKNGKIVNYIDQRRFGTFHLVEDFELHSGLKQLGPDVLSKPFTADYLYERLQKIKKPIYSALMDQNVIAGLGNIYVNEVLHACSIHPLQPANTISLAQCAEIVTNTVQILAMALKMKGTTLVDNLYQDPDGKKGTFYRRLQVYGKKNDSNVTVLKISGRSAFVHKDTKLKVI